MREVISIHIGQAGVQMGKREYRNFSFIFSLQEIVVFLCIIFICWKAL